MSNTEDNLLVTRKQLCDMGLSIPQIDKVLEKMKPVYIKTRAEKPHYVFSDFQDLWCTLHKGVWVSSTPTRPVKTCVKITTPEGFVSLRPGGLMYDVIHIVKFYSEKRQWKSRYGNISFKKIRTMVYWMWVCRYMRYNIARVGYEYVMDTGAPLNNLIKKSIAKLVEQKAVYWKRTSDFDNASKYYYINEEYPFNYKKATIRMINSYHGKHTRQEYLHLAFAVGILAKSYHTRFIKQKLGCADYNVIYRMFLNRKRAKEFYDIIKDRIEVKNAPEFND